MNVVLTSGCFDGIHPGHLYHLERSRAMGDILVVALTSDRFVNKGPGRPKFTWEQRRDMLAALRCVDLVLRNDEAIPYGAIRCIKPRFYTKHEEYRGRLPEQALVEELGGMVRFTDWKVFSSTELMKA